MIDNEKDALIKELLCCVDFALSNLKSTGSGMTMDGNKLIHWKNWFADVAEKVPGVKVDREAMMATHKRAKS
jgi:hypothetical protein